MNAMKTILMGVAALITATAMQSCSDDDDKYVVFPGYGPNALVTVKTEADKTVYLQLDDKTTLFPTNMKQSPFGDKEVRALVNCVATGGNSAKYDKAVYVNWIDSILTKPAIAWTEGMDVAQYGSDPVEIVKDWVTIAEDGYLTLRFRTVWAGGKAHWINLLTGVNKDNPYEVRLCHNAYGETTGRTADALVAFSLKNLPDTEGKTVKLTLKWNSFSGEKSVEFDYCTRKGTNAGKLQAEQALLHSVELK